MCKLSFPMRARLFLALSLCAVATHAAPAGKLSDALPEIDQRFIAWVEKQHMPGAVMGIIVDGDLVWLKTTGVRDVAGGAPVTPDTVFRIASMTKSFTAMAILKLRDEGKLSLDDPVSKYIPELAKLSYPTKDSPPITIRLLLTHSEGFPEDNPWGDRQLAQSDATLSDWMRAGIPFSTAPGTAYEYSNYGFAILGQIVGRVSKRPYADYMRDNILRPLGMTSTTYLVNEVPADRIAKGYKWDGKSWTEEPALPHGAFGAMGGLWTTPRDLARYVSFLMSAFPPRDDPERGPIRRSSAREMQQAWRSSPAFATRQTVDAPLELSVNSYGYGLGVVQDCRFPYMVQHGGGLPGYGSLERWLPDYSVGIIAFGNVTYAGFRLFFDDVLTAMLATGALQRRPAQPSAALLQAQNDVSSLIMHWDGALAHRIASDNLFLDQSETARKEDLLRFAEAHGACRAATTIDAENALRGTWQMPCERGALQVRITLAPTTPPKVQSLDLRSILPPSDETRRAIESKLATVPAQWGKCAIGDSISASAMRVNCDHGALTARVSDTEVTFTPLRDLDHRCVP
jgi:CubicO group peptidase (beta-lactamase class C family)